PEARQKPRPYVWSFPFLWLQHVRWQPMSTGHLPSQSGDTTIATNSPSQSSGSITSAGCPAGSAAGDTAVASSARCMPLLMAGALEWVGISLSLPSLLSFANENSALAGDGSGDGCPLLSPPNPDRDGSRRPSSKPAPPP